MNFIINFSITFETKTRVPRYTIYFLRKKFVSYFPKLCSFSRISFIFHKITVVMPFHVPVLRTKFVKYELYAFFVTEKEEQKRIFNSAYSRKTETRSLLDLVPRFETFYAIFNEQKKKKERFNTHVPLTLIRAPIKSQFIFVGDSRERKRGTRCRIGSLKRRRVSDV